MVDLPVDAVTPANAMRIRAGGARAAQVALLAFAPLTLVACSGEAVDSGPPPVIGSYVTGVQVLGQEQASADIRGEQLPAGGANGPAVEVDREATVVSGGSLRQPISASAAFTTLRLAIEGLGATTPSTTDGGSPAPTQAPGPAPTGSGTPAPGFYEIALAAADTEVEIVLTIAQTPPGSLFTLYYAVVDGSGVQGSAAKQTVQSKQVGTGEVQVSVSWDAPSDVDLHLVDPDGDEIYYDAPVSNSGGQFDLDSNAECDIDNINNENITWITAPAGGYTVRLDYWDSCDVEKTSYVVTVRVVGQPASVFSGEFTGDGDHGGAGDGITITDFTVVGPSPSASPSPSL